TISCSNPRPPRCSCPAAKQPRREQNSPTAIWRTHLRRSRIMAGPGFLGGPLPLKLFAFAGGRGLFLEPAGFEKQGARWDAPLTGQYRDVTIFNTPPPTQGFTVIEMLNLGEPFEPHRMDLLGADRLHLLVQAKQIAYHDRDILLADPAFADVPVDRLVSREYAHKRRRLINPA